MPSSQFAVCTVLCFVVLCLLGWSCARPPAQYENDFIYWPNLCVLQLGTYRVRDGSVSNSTLRRLLLRRLVYLSERYRYRYFNWYWYCSSPLYKAAEKCLEREDVPQAGWVHIPPAWESAWRTQARGLEDELFCRASMRIHAGQKRERIWDSFTSEGEHTTVVHINASVAFLV